MYFVFRRRPDGHVSGIKNQSRAGAESILRPYWGGKTEWSYEILLETDDWWGEALPLIERERI